VQRKPYGKKGFDGRNAQLRTIMQSTSVAVGGKGTNAKTALYVGGLEESVTEATLHSTFIPFGEIKDVSVPLDNATGMQLLQAPGFSFDLSANNPIDEKADASTTSFPDPHRFGR
jgi:hypothetical protein